MTRQPWIGKPMEDIILILLPPFASLLVIAAFPHLFENNKELPDIWWIVLVLLIDVGHVYSTLYRTYLNPAVLGANRSLLWTIPFFGFVSGVLLYSFSHLFFWRLLAYLAVFHFIRQQYGFMRLYSRKDHNVPFYKLIDKVTIYAATIYPLLYWHLKGPRNFNWFIDGDFYYLNLSALVFPLSVVYLIIIAAYLCKEVFVAIKYKRVNFPKIAIIAGTISSWYFGVIYYNGDLAFTFLNVVSHGIPYIALIYIYGRKTHTPHHSKGMLLKLVFSRFGWIVFLITIFVLAFVEEGIWDLTVWQEHKAVFSWTESMKLNLSEEALNLIVPLLALPQITHYIVDGFIWKNSGKAVTS